MKTNENKKSNKKLLVVAGMAALLALVGYMGGSTFAKYVTEQNVETETAVVAKWGYVVKMDATKLFGDGYKNDKVVTDGVYDGVEVKASTSTLAPGTKGELKINVSGTAEVLSKVTVSTTNTSDVCLTNDGTAAVDYHPVVWTISGTATVGTQDLLDGVDLTDITTAQMITALGKLNQASIAPNTSVNYDLTVSWVWVFEDSANKDLYNKYDTMLGDLAALDSTGLTNKYGANVPTGTTSVDFGIKVTVEQLDK